MVDAAGDGGGATMRDDESDSDESDGPPGLCESDSDCDTNHRDMYEGSCLGDTHASCYADTAAGSDDEDRSDGGWEPPPGQYFFGPRGQRDREKMICALHRAVRVARAMWTALTALLVAARAL